MEEKNEKIINYNFFFCLTGCKPKDNITYNKDNHEIENKYGNEEVKLIFENREYWKERLIGVSTYLISN